MKKYRIAIIGAGPSGYFAIQSLLNSANEEIDFQIDLIEKLPIPWGLVRWGVAPDHPKIRTVGKVFEKLANDPRVKLYGNVEVGKDVSIDDLKKQYDAVVIATGAPIGKKLGIPGENLKNSISAAEFVPWYNGHFDYTDLDIDLDFQTAVIVGAGNVAMDCGRILAITPDELQETDLAAYALEKFKNSKVKNTYIVARRSLEHAAFTSAELRDLPKLEHTNVIVDQSDVALAHREIDLEKADKELVHNLQAFTEISEKSKPNLERTLEFRFCLTPKEIHGKEKVEGITFQINRMENGKAIPTDETLTISCGLVVSAIGYETQSIPGLKLTNGKVPNENGYVEDNLYVVGWAKRGPSGVIGTNKSDANEVMHLLIEKLAQPKEMNGIENLLPGNLKIINQRNWEAINSFEIAEGEKIGRPRLKVTNWEEAVNIGLQGNQ